jgi:excisionase family DNA binding protein
MAPPADGRVAPRHPVGSELIGISSLAWHEAPRISPSGLKGLHVMCRRMEATMSRQRLASHSSDGQQPPRMERVDQRHQVLGGEARSAVANPSGGAGAPGSAALLTVAEAAKELRVSVRGLRRWIATGHVQIVRFGRAIRIPRSEVQRLAETGIADRPLPRAGPP